MKEYPILFSAPMVRAILDGRKTQTRRHASISSMYRLTDERLCAIHSNYEHEIAVKTNTCITKRRLPGGQRREDLLPHAICWIWAQGARGLVCVDGPRGREGILSCFLVPQEQEGNKSGASSGLYGVSWHAPVSQLSGQALGWEQAEQCPIEFALGNASGELGGSPRAWHCNNWGEALGIKVVRRGTGAYSIRRNNGALFPPPRRTSAGDVTICHFRALPWSPNSRLWVKETFRLSTSNDCACYEPCGCKSGVPIYRASCGDDSDQKWKSPIFMPRWASRITLEIVNVRVERLQDISEEDAAAEGLLFSTDHIGYWSGTGVKWWNTSREAYADLWESINGTGSWDKNPWVWALTFKRV